MAKKSKDLLKDAIADAKAVRATALANAKLALEEAFTPKLQNMLSKKLQQEMEEENPELDDVEDETMDDVTMEEEFEDEPVEDEEEIEFDETELEEPVEEEEEIGDDEMDFEIEDDEIEEPVEEEEEIVDDEEEDILDLESVIKELEGDEEIEDIDLDIEEDAEIADTNDIITEPIDEEDELDFDIEDDEVEEPVTEEEELDFDIEDDEVEEPVTEEEEYDDIDFSTDEKADDLQENKKLKKSLIEAYNVIKYMKKQISEVNLLNAKLLFANKLFKAFELNEQQKTKVVNTIDRAVNVREAKIIYVTLAESIQNSVKKAAQPNRTVKKITEGLASKSIASTKPKKEVLTESDSVVNRFQKLANIKK